MARWQCHEKIGDNGGFGEVYSCDKIIGDTVEPGYAMKKLIDLQSDSITRFQREVRTLKRLNHPRIVKVEEANLTGKPYFYTMKKYMGSLHSIVEELPGEYSRIKTIFNSIFDGVEYLHNQGIYHRDLKPENILYNSDMDIAISDFGFQLNINSNSTRLTQFGGLGTPFYCAPEQWRDSKSADYRSDIYSLGKMIYECCVGTRDTDLELNKLPTGIRYVVEFCIKNSPEERFQTIDVLRQSFNSSIDRTIAGITTDDIINIINRLKSSKLNDAPLSDFIKCFSALDMHSKQDLVEEIFMTLPIEVFTQLANVDLIVVKNIVNEYVSYVTSQSWSFDYTDKIGDRCETIYHSVTDFDIHANLIYAIIQVGVSHNRWHVMGIASKLLNSITDYTEAFAIAQKIKPLEDDVAQLDLEVDTLQPPLKDLVNKISSKK